MKARLGAILSVAGVLSAGGAAAIVNAQVLGGSSSHDSHALSTPETVVAVTITDVVTTTAPVSTPSSSDAPTTTVAPSTSSTASSSLPNTPHTVATTLTAGPTAGSAVTSSPAATTQPSAPATAPPTTAPSTTPAPQPSSSTATYQLAGAGTVTLRATADTLTVVGVSPASGWIVHDSGNETASSVRVRLRAEDGAEVRFEASVVLGVVSTHTEQSPGSGGGSGGDD